MDLINLLAGAIKAASDAKTASDAEAQAAALADLDAKIAGVNAARASFTEELAAGKSEAAEALHKKFHPEDTKPE